MALSASEIVTLTDITLRSREDVAVKAALLSAEQESAIRDEIDAWEPVKYSHVKVKGGRDGVDFDNERKREAIRLRVLNHLGFDLAPLPTMFTLAQASRGA